MNYKHLMAASTIALSSFSFAQDEPVASSPPINLDSGIGLIGHVRLIITDEVSDGCWTNISAVESRIKSKLLQANISVYDEELAHYESSYGKLRVSATGYRAGSICAAMLKYSLLGTAYGETVSYRDSREWRYPLASILFADSYITTNRDNLNDQLLDMADESTDGLIAAIYASRQDPEVENVRLETLTHKAMTEVELEEYLRKIDQEQ